MPSTKQKAARRRRYPVHRIQRACIYDPAEIAKLLDVHRNTVRHWLRDGLAAIDDRRPVLIQGAVLKAFLVERQQSRQRKCALDELFCFRCREPRKPWGGVADLSFRSDKIGKLTALCCVCETAMHRAIRRADVPAIAKLISLQTLPSEPLIDCPDASASCDFEKERSDAETEPAE